MIAIRVCPICKKVFEGRVGVRKSTVMNARCLKTSRLRMRLGNSHLGFLRILRIQKKKIQECMRQGKINYSTL